MSTTYDARLKALEEQVQRLKDFNQLLLDHLLQVQNFGGPGIGPSEITVSTWLTNLSDAAYEKYRYAPL